MLLLRSTTQTQQDTNCSKCSRSTQLKSNKFSRALISRSLNGKWDNTTSNWNPIIPFRVYDADVSVVFLVTNGIGYLKPVHDPMFHATQQSMRHSEVFIPTRGFGIMACLDRHQICEMTHGACTRLSSVGDLSTDSEVTLNAAQNITALRISKAAYGTEIWMHANTIGATGTLALHLLISPEFEI
jgi:hypothetical protein